MEYLYFNILIKLEQKKTHGRNSCLRYNNNTIIEKGEKMNNIIVNYNIQSMPLLQYGQNIVHS